MNFTIVVYALNESTFLKVQSRLEQICIDVNVIWCNATKTERAEVINQNLNTWLLFIDHDCEISAENIDCIRLVIEKNSSLENIVFSGLYVDASDSGYLQKGHNFIANNWLIQSFDSANAGPLILGGAFLILGNKEIRRHKDGLFWGAEDKALSYELIEAGFSVYLLKELTVIHKTSNTWKHFLKRAYVHGKNDINYIKNDKNKVNYFFWIRKIGFANLHFLPLIVCHFCIQRWAELIQIARR